MPLTAALAVVAAAAMAGVPLLNGFLSKEMFFAETVFLDRPGWQLIALPLAATLAGIFSVAYSLRLIQQVFFGPLAGDLPHTPREPTRWMLLPSALLVCACVLVGIVPEQIIGPYLRTATTAILGSNAPIYSLAVWHGLNAPLLMSLVALGGGTLLYFTLLARRRAVTTPVLQAIDGRRLFDISLKALRLGAEITLSRLSSNRLQTQVLLIFALALGGAILLAGPVSMGPQLSAAQPIDPAFALLWLVGGACALAVARLAKFHRLAAIAFAGGAGLATSLTFVWFSAPDLALTQLTVEVVTTVLILLGLRWLPRRDKTINAPRGATTRLRRMRDVLLAAACGLGLAAISYAVLIRPAPEGPGPFFVQNALPLGGGLNVVNVILVDFRGFDTFGEITVLGIVALTVYALLRRFRPAPESMQLPRQQHEQAGPDTSPTAQQDALLPAGPMMLPAVLVRLLLPLALLVSLFFLLRGHNAPGGGFIGGLILATAVILQYLVGGIQWVETRLRIHPLYWTANGLLLAGAAGIGATLAGTSFLSSQAWHGTLPIIGELHLSSVLLFDLGVYMLVVGATVLMLVAIAHQSLRSYHRSAASGGTG